MRGSEPRTSVAGLTGTRPARSFCLVILNLAFSRLSEDDLSLNKFFLLCHFSFTFFPFLFRRLFILWSRGDPFHNEALTRGRDMTT